MACYQDKGAFPNTETWHFRARESSYTLQAPSTAINSVSSMLNAKGINPSLREVVKQQTILAFPYPLCFDFVSYCANPVTIQVKHLSAALFSFGKADVSEKDT